MKHKLGIFLIALPIIITYIGMIKDAINGSPLALFFLIVTAMGVSVFVGLNLLDKE